MNLKEWLFGAATGITAWVANIVAGKILQKQDETIKELAALNANMIRQEEQMKFINQTLADHNERLTLLENRKN